MKKYEGYQARFAAGEEQILETDPDCRTLHSKDGLRPAYNVQSVVDTRSQLIADFEVTSANTDMNLRSVMSGIVPDVGFRYDKDERVFTLEHIEAEITEEQRASTKPEGIQACLHAGALPQCYEGTNIQVEVQRLGRMSCFLRYDIRSAMSLTTSENSPVPGILVFLQAKRQAKLAWQEGKCSLFLVKMADKRSFKRE